jgi:hypothetical protein
MEVTDSDNASLLQNGIIYDLKMFYNIGPTIVKEKGKPYLNLA